MPPAGAAFAELVELCPFLLDWKNSVYELLFDFVQPYRGRAHSTGIVGLRCRDVSVRNLGKAWNTAVLAVIPGPQAPKNLTPYFQLTRDALQKFASEGFPVTQLGQSFNTRGAIVTCQADGQARVKMGNFVGLGSRFGACSWCWWEGRSVPNPGGIGRTIRFMGYSEAEPQSIR